MGFGFVEFQNPNAQKRVLRAGKQHSVISGTTVTVEEYFKRGKKFNKKIYSQYEEGDAKGHKNKKKGSKKLRGSQDYPKEKIGKNEFIEESSYSKDKRKHQPRNPQERERNEGYIKNSKNPQNLQRQDQLKNILEPKRAVFETTNMPTYAIRIKRPEDMDRWRKRNDNFQIISKNFSSNIPKKMVDYTDYEGDSGLKFTLQTRTVSEAMSYKNAYLSSLLKNATLNQKSENPFFDKNSQKYLNPKRK